jgi:hypothetical protein
MCLRAADVAAVEEEVARVVAVAEEARGLAVAGVA